MNYDDMRVHIYMDANLHLLTLERRGWRRWIFGRWLYSSEPFRNDIARRLNASGMDFPVPKDAERLDPDHELQSREGTSHE